MLGLLDNMLDCGMSEEHFWSSTLDEIDRFAQSYIRVSQRKAKEKAQELYTLAGLIAPSISRLFAKNGHYESIETYFPGLFEEENQAAYDLKVTEGFKDLARAFNSTYKETSDDGRTITD